MDQEPGFWDQDLVFFVQKYESWSEMGPYGSVEAGRSPMAHDHFQTPPDPKKGYKNPKMIPKTRTNLIKGFHERLPNLTWFSSGCGERLQVCEGLKSTARVSLRKYFIPVCFGRGLDLDLRIRPAAPAAPAPAASGNPGFGPLGMRSKNKIFKRHGL